MLGFVFVGDFFTLYHGIHHHLSPPFGRIFLEKMCEKIEDLGEILSGTADQMEDTSFFHRNGKRFKSQMLHGTAIFPAFGLNLW